MSLADVRHWVFDMDGTLTVAVHDFAAIRVALAIPPEDDILTHLAALPAEEAAAEMQAEVRAGRLDGAAVDSLVYDDLIRRDPAGRGSSGRCLEGIHRLPPHSSPGRLCANCRLRRRRSCRL